MIKISNMIIQLFLPVRRQAEQYKHIEKEGDYWLNSNNYYKLEDNNEKCIYCSFSAIINYG